MRTMRCRSPRSATVLAAVLVAAALAATGAGNAAAGSPPPPFDARAGESLARDAAAAWADDARLVYVENDESLGAVGDAARWGYLFRSAARAESRAYSVRAGKIAVAEDHGFDFDAPPIGDAWIESRQALAAADRDAGLAYREKHGGRVRAMFLVRGAMDIDAPDAPTWTVVYAAEGTSGLWVVVDARDGKVVRTWRG